MSVIDNLKNIPTRISAGQSTILKNKRQLLTYPSTRGDGRTQNIVAESLYKAGLNFDCYTREKATYSSMKDFRKSQKASNIGTALSAISIAASGKQGMNLALSIVMPPSAQAERRLEHNFNSSKMSTLERGSNSVIGMASAVVSDMVGGIVDKATGGAFADNDEALASVVRNTYSGVNNRERTYSWELEPRNMTDLAALLEIVRTFEYRSLGTLNKGSKTIEQIGDTLKSGGQAVQDKVFGENATKQVVVPAAIDFLSNQLTISNPDIWMISEYSTSSAIPSQDIFGPAQIKSISVDPIVDGEYSGLKSAPNHSGRLKISITFLETITLDRSSY